MTTFLLDIVPILATFFLTVAYLPQIVETARTKDVRGISLPFWVLINVALLLMLINSIVIYVQFGTYGYMITEILNFGMAFVMLLMVLKYRKNKPTAGPVDFSGIKSKGE